MTAASLYTGMTIDSRSLVPSRCLACLTSATVPPAWINLRRGAAEPGSTIACIAPCGAEGYTKRPGRTPVSAVRLRTNLPRKFRPILTRGQGDDDRWV